MQETLIIGVGGSGTQCGKEMAKRLGLRLASVNTDWTPKVDPFVEKVEIGEKTCKGGSAVTTARGKRAAEESRAVLEKLVSDCRQVVLVAGLGGGTGTGATPVIARIARERGVHVVCAVILPFDFERERHEQAVEGLRELENGSFTVFVESNADAFNVESKMSLSEVLDGVQDRLIRKVGKYLQVPVNETA